MHTIEELKVHGNSMYPVIKDKDSVQVTLFESPNVLDSFEEGDVLFLRNEREWHVHRLVKDNNRRVTKGDWASVLDETAQVWGLVTAVNKKKDPLLKDALLGRLSIEVSMDSSSVRRRLFRMAMIAYVKFSRGLRFWR